MHLKVPHICIIRNNFAFSWRWLGVVWAYIFPVSSPYFLLCHCDDLACGHWKWMRLETIRVMYFRSVGTRSWRQSPPHLVPLNAQLDILRSKTSTTHGQLSKTQMLMPLGPLEVDSANDHQSHVFLPCGDPIGTSFHPAPGTPERPVGYSEVKNEPHSRSAFQNTNDHAFVAIGSG